MIEFMCMYYVVPIIAPKQCLIFRRKYTYSPKITQLSNTDKLSSSRITVPDVVNVNLDRSTSYILPQSKILLFT